MERKKEISEKDIILAIIIISGIALAFFAYVNFAPKGNEAISAKITRIGGCAECFDLTKVSSAVEEKAEVKSDNTLDFKSQEAKKIIEKYGIQRIPALIVESKNIDELGLDENIFRIEGNAAIFDKPAPYYDLASGNIKGKVSVIEIYDESCDECYRFSGTAEQFKKLGINNDYKIFKKENAKQLIKENEIENLPVLLISKDIKEYWWIFDGIKSTLKEKANYYVLQGLFLPYKEISTGKIKGKVSVIALANKSCTDCFNVSKLKDSIKELGVYFTSEREVDISSEDGKTLKANYNVTAIPTVILSKEIADYKNLKEILTKFGTFEKDESYVFRQLDVLKGTYQKI